MSFVTLLVYNYLKLTRTTSTDFSHDVILIFLTEDLHTTMNKKVKHCFRFVFSSVESRLGCFCRQLALTLLILRLDCSEREKQKFNSYFQISVKTLWNIGRAAVLESDTKVERCENFEGKFLTENF